MLESFTQNQIKNVILWLGSITRQVSNIYYSALVAAKVLVDEINIFSKTANYRVVSKHLELKLTYKWYIGLAISRLNKIGALA